MWCSFRVKVEKTGLNVADHDRHHPALACKRKEEYLLEQAHLFPVANFEDVVSPVEIDFEAKQDAGPDEGLLIFADASDLVVAGQLVPMGPRCITKGQTVEELEVEFIFQ